MASHQQAGHGQISKISAAGLLVTLGIIYGDIGTSPLYVFRSIMGERQITEQLVLRRNFSCNLDTGTTKPPFQVCVSYFKSR
jgi:KUP system potassium uptake protein